MATRIKITTATPNTYRFAETSASSGGYPWLGLLQGRPKLYTKGKDPDGSSQIRSIRFKIANNGGTIPLSENLWGATVDLEIETASGTKTWSGVIKSYSQDSKRVMTVSAAEDPAEELSREIPDEVVRLGTWSNAGASAVNQIIPTTFGGTAADPVIVRGVLVDRVNFRYVLCVGEIQQIVKVYKNREEITTGFTTSVGSSGAGTLPGYAYVEFSADPRDDANVWPEIHAEVVGLDLNPGGGLTEAQCRNPARVLFYLMTTAATGACGWGLGIPSGKLDATTFNQAMTDCDTAGFRLDGAMRHNLPARQWIDQILLACRGRLVFEGGTYYLYIDQPKVSAMTFTAATMKVSSYGKGRSTQRTNRIVLNYRYDAYTGQLLGSQTRDDSTSQSLIDVQDRELTAHLLRDHTTAGKIADYLLYFEQYGEDLIEFTTKEDIKDLAIDDRITITNSDYGLSSAAFRVIGINRGDTISTIEARSYSGSIYGTTGASTPSDPAVDPVVPGTESVTPPAVPSGLSLSTGTSQAEDGTTFAWVQGSFSAGTRTLAAKIEYGIGVAPGTWYELFTTRDAGWRHEPLVPGTVYTYRVTPFNTGGDGTAATVSTTAGGDTTAPGTPQTPTVSVYFKNVRIRCWQNATKPNDMAAFKVYRNTTNNSGTASEIGSVDCTNQQDGVVLMDEGTNYGQTYYYWTKAVDRTGNTSGFSPVASVTTGQVDTGDVVDGAISAVKTALAAINSTTGDLNANTVGANQIIAGSICTCHLVAGSVTAGSLAAGAVCTCHLAAAGVSADCITAGSMSADRIDTGTLCASVALCSCQGCIGSWTINTAGINKIYGSYHIGIGGWAGGTGYGPHFYAGYGTGANLITIGRHHYLPGSSSWVDHYGIVVNAGASTLFRVTTDAAGTGSICANIAGWDFTSACLYSGNLKMIASGSIQGNYSAGSAGWCIGNGGSAEFNDVTVRGTVCTCAGYVGKYGLTSCGLVAVSGTAYACLNDAWLKLGTDCNHGSTERWTETYPYGFCAMCGCHATYGRYHTWMEPGAIKWVHGMPSGFCNSFICQCATNHLYMYSCGILSVHGGAGLNLCGTVCVQTCLITGGKVGIKNSAPAYSLSIGDNTDQEFIVLESSNADQGGILFSDGGTNPGGIFYDHDGDYMFFRTNPSERMRIDSSGNVGIGNAIMSTMHAANAAGNLVVGDGTNNAGITIYSNSANTGRFRFADGTSGNPSYIGGFDYNHSTDSMGFRVAAVTRMTIDCSGTVCIPSANSCALYIPNAVTYGAYVKSASYSVYGEADTTCIGVYGLACTCIGVYGVACSYYGVYGYSHVGRPVAGNGPYYDTTSSRTLKISRGPIEVLPLVRDIRVECYVYRDAAQHGYDHFIGPYADDFRDAFGLHSDPGMFDRNVAGVALAGVKELDNCTHKLLDCITAMSERIQTLERSVA
jgi:hypothetical protein